MTVGAGSQSKKLIQEINRSDQVASNLDPGRSLELMLLFEKINEMGTTVLVVTHERELVREMQKRVITIEDGHVIHDTCDEEDYDEI